jgi:hypothetical protein
VSEKLVGQRRRPAGSERLLGRAVEQELGDRDPAARDDSRSAAGGAVLEVLRESGREIGAVAALDAAGHPEAQVGSKRPTRARAGRRYAGTRPWPRPPRRVTAKRAASEATSDGARMPNPERDTRTLAALIVTPEGVP